MDLNSTRRASIPIGAPRPLAPSRAGIALWRPEIITPPPVTRASSRVLIAEPGLRPEAMRAQMDAARSALASLAEAREVLRARADAAEARAVTATTERERVAAMFDTYRVKTALDDILRTTFQRVSGLMEERGLR